MGKPRVLVGTWTDGVVTLGDGEQGRELAGHVVTALAPDGRAGVLAIVDGHTVQRRSRDGSWTTLATTDAALACCVATADVIYLGTDDARVLRLAPDGSLTALASFDHVAGRERWYAGQAVVDGRVVGPPLGVRSITVTADGGAILANVHVGGIPRSTDGGVTWTATVDVDSDVHEVRAHPERPELVVAAAAVGLCASHDGGATWSIASEGLHATHATGVAFAGGDVFLSAAESQFADRARLYRRPSDGRGALVPAGEGLPDWLGGVVDTRCIGTLGNVMAFADATGSVYVSPDAGQSWSLVASGIASPSSVLVY